MSKSFFLIFSFLFKCLSIDVSTLDPPFVYMKHLSDVAASGDEYPKKLPKLIDSKLYANMKILFVLSHGVEDHEVYYQHQYFDSRGALISFACPDKFAIISDFFKPTHKLNCIELSTINLEMYDGIYIPGGLPSSSAIRKERDFQIKLSNFYNNPTNKNKMVMMICSGTENLLDSGLINYTKEITGSPASQWTFYSYFAYHNLSLELYKGNSDSYPSIAYPSDGFHAHLVLGRNPAASPSFVSSIAKTWKSFDESSDVTNGDELKMINNYWYNHPDFEILNDNEPIDDIANLSLSDLSIQLNLRRTTGLEGKRIFIALSSGANYDQVFNLWQSLSIKRAEITFICPWWIIPYKESKVFLFSEPPTTPIAYVTCKKGFDSIKNDEFDTIIVTSGVFSTNAVLRNDNQLVKILRNSKLVGLIGSGIDLLLPMRKIIKETVVMVNEIESDILFSGGIIGQRKIELILNGANKILVGENLTDEFLKKIEEHLQQV